MKMKMVSKEFVASKAVITTEERGFFFNVKVRKFEAQIEFPKGYWRWLELPDYTLVPDVLSFQLDAWNKL